MSGCVYTKDMKKAKLWRRMAAWLLVAAFVAMISWMLYDILQRDTSVSSDTDVLVMGTNATFKPFEYKDGGNVVGFDVELAQQIAKDMGKELKIEDMSFDGLLPALESGQIDMAVAGMSVTADREKNALFSDSYYRASQRIVVPKNSKIANKYQLENKRIAVQLGTTGDQAASKIKGAQVIQFPAAPNALQELAAGKVDAAVIDDAPAKQYVSGFPTLKVINTPLSSESYAIAFKKGNTELAEHANKTIANMKADGRYEALLQKYFGTSGGQTL